MNTKDKKVIRSSKHGFSKRKSCLTNLITFYEGMTSLVSEGDQWVLPTWISETRFSILSPVKSSQSGDEVDSEVDCKLT